jgi:cytosine/adenosine deaminase-related metal-dependent hydrolase
MEYVEGTLLTVDSLEKGYLGVDHGMICERGQGKPPKPALFHGIITPPLINAHTHIGDSFIAHRSLDLPETVEELVAPPEGLKHRLLQEASDDEIVTGMKESIYIMRKTGTSLFFDFRENGSKGVALLTQALTGTPVSACIFARPRDLSYNKDEVDLLLHHAQGIGVSSLSDWEYEELVKIARHTHRRKKVFALHASERIREDIDLILDLHPDLLIHLTRASDGDLERVRDHHIPVVVCPRSNLYFGLKPKLDALKNHGIEILLGTDNGMLHSPVLLEEIHQIKRLTSVFSDEELLRMVTYSPRKALNLKHSIHGLNPKENFVVLDEKTLQLLYYSLNNNGEFV